MELIFIGYPGSGKGTQAGLLSDRYTIPKISTGDILRAAVAAKTPVGIKAKKFMEAGELVPDEVMIDLVVQRINEPDSVKGYILDGFPRTVNQAQELDRILLDYNREISAVISLEIERRKVIDRLTSRRVCEQCGHAYHLQYDPPPGDHVCSVCGGRIFQRTDDNRETVLHRMEVYKEATGPLKSYYGMQGKLIPIDGSLNIEKVYSEIVRRLESTLDKTQLA